MALAQSAGAGGTGWRLPNIKELASRVAYGQASPLLDLLAFPDAVVEPGVDDWAATHRKGEFGNSPLGVNFYSGSVGAPTFEGVVRLVRGGR